MEPADWVPMRWPSEAEWLKPESLSVIDGTPINCLVLTAAHINAAPFVAAVRSRGAAIVHEGKPPDSIAVPSETVWPGVKLGRQGEADAGPTGPPWVDSNGWRCLLAKAKSPGKPVWVFADPPAEFQPSASQAHVVALADAAAHGGRWVVSLDAITRKGMMSGDAAALERWKGIVNALKFFEQHRSWRTFPTAARLGVLSDFEGANEFLAQEILNLAPRRYLSYRVIDVATSSAASFEGLKGIVWVDEKPPAPRVSRLLTAFISGGGVLIAQPGTTSPPPAAKPVKHKTGYAVYTLGAGRIAVAPEAWTDPYVVAADVHLLLSRRYDVYRVFNSGATNVHCTAGQNRSMVLHILNYTGRVSHNPMSVFVAQSYSSARWSGLTSHGLENLKVNHAAEGVEVNLPPFAAYAAVEFGGHA